MNTQDLENYHRIHNGEVGFYQQQRGLIEVSGKEAVQFLNGLITNDVAKLEDNAQIPAAFPDAKGRLIALVRVMRNGDKFLFETEETTHEKVFNNLFRFTFAGDFFVEDLSEKYAFFSISNLKSQIPNSFVFETNFGADCFVPNEEVENFKTDLSNQNAVEISDELYEVLRIENGIPLYGVDMDETTIVPELGDFAISYTKGCYIGQEIIARIHFRGHVAKQLRGLVLLELPAVSDWLNDEETKQLDLKSPEGKPAGKITSVTFSPKLDKIIALGFVRYEFLAEETDLIIGETTAKVKNLPFV